MDPGPVATPAGPAAPPARLHVLLPTPLLSPPGAPRGCGYQSGCRCGRRWRAITYQPPRRRRGTHRRCTGAARPGPVGGQHQEPVPRPLRPSAPLQTAGPELVETPRLYLANCSTCFPPPRLSARARGLYYSPTGPAAARVTRTTPPSPVAADGHVVQTPPPAAPLLCHQPPFGLGGLDLRSARLSPRGPGPQDMMSSPRPGDRLRRCVTLGDALSAIMTTLTPVAMPCR